MPPRFPDATRCCSCGHLGHVHAVAGARRQPRIRARICSRSLQARIHCDLSDALSSCVATSIEFADTRPSSLRHWRYISSFHGPWLQLPPEILETLANINYRNPLPRPIDPAVFFDLLKIRRLVDDATDLAVRAANGMASLKNLDNSHHAAALGLGLGGPNQPKLSAERKHKLREQATQKLARAYRLDEIACSVATMQSASSLEDVASLVLRRDPKNVDARYVHFFHEKIPSRQLAESTSLDALDDVIASQPSECEALRTRATVRVFKEDYKGAAKDLTEALAVLKMRNKHKAAGGTSKELQVFDRDNCRTETRLEEDQQPSSLEAQLLFARAGVYLSLACLMVGRALETLPSVRAREARGDGASIPRHDVVTPVAEQATAEEASSRPTDLAAGELAAEESILEARKVVKSNAKRALRDYMAYLTKLYYSPNLPTDIAEDFSRKVKAGKHKGRRPTSNIRTESLSGDSQHQVYTLRELFTATPPSDLPPYPPVDTSVAGPAPESATYVGTTMEIVTYHPLLTDALHSILLCHVLVQTSTKELQRHAHMVARLARLADGYPIFQASRSPARADWIEVLRQGNNWIGLSSSWETLCSPTSLYPTSTNGAARSGPQNALPASSSAGARCADELNKEAIHQEALRRAFEDDRVVDEEMFRVAYQAHKKSVEADLKLHRDRSSVCANADSDDDGAAHLSTTNGAADTTLTKHTTTSTSNKARPKPATINTQDLVHPNASPVSPGTAHRRWAMDEGREYPILTERASAVARWQREAPAATSGTGSSLKKRRRKKKPAADPALEVPAA